MRVKWLRVFGIVSACFVAACSARMAPSAAPSSRPVTPPAASTPAAPAMSTSPSDADVQRILAERIGELGEHYGIVVGLVDASGRRVLSRGSFAKGNERALDGDTLFELGSISKVFTSLLLQIAVERGEMRLDDPLGRHLPAGTQVPSFNGRPITLHHLATHTSGLPRVPTNLTVKDANDPYADYTVENLYEFLASAELTREPGSEYAYSNLGAALLARALLVRTGKSYAELVRERITEPLGMPHTWVDVPEDVRARLAMGHTQTLAEAPLRTRIAMIGNGGVFSTAKDMLTFLSASMGLVDTPLASAFERIATPQRPINDEGGTVGLGWHIDAGKGADVVWHNGGTAGFTTFAGYVRDQRVGVVVLSNASTPDGVDDIGMHLLAQGSLEPAGAPGVTPSRPRVKVALDPRLLDVYVGDYRLEAGPLMAMRREGDQFWVRLAEKASFRLFAESDTVFFMDVMDLTFRFETDGKGPATAVFVGENGKESRVPRTLSPPSSP